MSLNLDSNHFNRYKRTGSIQVATVPVRLIFAIVSACGLHFLPYGPHLSLRPRYTYTALQRSTAMHYVAASLR